MDTSIAMSRLEAAVEQQVLISGGDGEMEAMASALLAALEPVIHQIALDLAEQAAAEVSAQLSSHDIDVVLKEGEPSLQVRSRRDSPEIGAESLDAREMVCDFSEITRVIKGWIDRRWLQHIMLERGARDALVTLIGYVGFIVAVLIGLGLAGVDLLGLTVVSGALALGIGFGMQEIANNFVSGLILLFERPIRAGDFVTVGEVEGFVRSIRIRATEIETLDNQNVLVPNSELVSGRVTNWVLRDTYGRLRILVGVAYGSDVEKVRDILEAVARAHPEAITDGRAPEPRALFMGFGDSSLDFELRVRINRIERRFQVTSDINFAINQAFRDAKIIIPFPQRDLHLISYPEAPAEPTPVKAKPKKSKAKAAIQAESVTRSHRAELAVSSNLEDVWIAVTDIDYLKKWLALDGEFTPQIGQPFSLSLRDGSEISGRIDVFMPPRRMRFVLAPREGEEPIPSGPITVDFFLQERDEKIQLTISIAGIPASEDWEEYYRLSEDRWHNALVELKHEINRK